MSEVQLTKNRRKLNNIVKYDQKDLDEKMKQFEEMASKIELNTHQPQRNNTLQPILLSTPVQIRKKRNSYSLINEAKNGATVSTKSVTHVSVYPMTRQPIIGSYRAKRTDPL